MKFIIEIDIPEVDEEFIDNFVVARKNYNAFVESKTVCRFNAVKYLVENPYNIITEITNQINTLITERSK